MLAKVQWELHGAKTGNCLRAAIALEEAGMNYQPVHVDLAHGEQRTDRHLALNLTGKVPVLVEYREGEPPFVLSQSMAIMLYAANQCPGVLMPIDTRLTAVATERLFLVAVDLIAPNHAAFFLRKLSERQAATKLDQETSSRLDWLERILEQHAYLAGSSFSLADISAYTFVAHLRSDALANRPKLAAWYARIGARDGVRRGHYAFS